MQQFLQFLAKKSVLLVGAALAVLANPFTYFIIGNVVFSISSPDYPGVNYNTHDHFVQTMMLMSGLGFCIIIISKISSWILAFQKIKSSKG